MPFIHEQSDKEYQHELFGLVAGLHAQKARRHDEVLGDPTRRTESFEQAERLARECKEFADECVRRISQHMKGPGVHADARAAVEGVLTRSHGLYESGSGTGKSLLCELVAAILDFPFERIDGQADMNDIQVIGIELPDLHSGFRLQRGLLLQPAIVVQVDEFKRIPASASNGLLQAYEERSVMVGTLRGSGQSRVKLSPAFVTLNTANPDTYLGSAGSSEALLDRIAYARRMSLPGFEDLVALCQESKFQRESLTPVALPATLYEIWSAIEFVRIPDPMAHAIVNCNYLVSPPEYLAANGWTSCSFEPTRRQKDVIVQLNKETTQYLSEGTNPRGIRLTALRARANAFFRGALTVDIADVRRAVQEALLFRLKTYPGTNPRVVADIIKLALDLTLPV